MPRPVRRAAHQARRVAQRARRLKARVEAVEHLRRTLNNAEGSVALQDRAQQHIAGGTLVMGTMIGDGAVVGTKAVVAKDVRPYAIVVGNPAREIGRRFSDEQVEALLRIRWWDWPVELVKQRVEALSSPDVDAFIARFDPGP